MVRSAGKPELAATFDDGDDEGGYASDGMQLLQGGATIQQSRTKFTSALKVQRERVIETVLKKTLDEAGRAGESFFYAWTVKDKHSPTGESIIEGIGIKGSMILVRNWGNCTVTVDVVSETVSHWTLSAGFVDFETGFNIDRLFRQRKGQGGGNYESERKLDINFQIGQSKAVRNIVVNALPSWIQDQCLETAKEASAGKYKDVPKHVPNFLREFAKLEITKAQLELKVGLPVEQWEPRDLVMLAAIGRAIKDRQTTVENEFPKVQPVAPANETTAAPANDSTAASGAPSEAAAAQTASGDVGPAATAATPPSAASNPAATEDASSAPPKSEPAQAVPAPIASGAISKEEMAEIARAEAAEAAREEPRPSKKRQRESGED